MDKVDLTKKYFSAALSFLLSRIGRGSKKECANAVGISSGYLGEIAKGIKRGDEGVRDKIAAFFLTNYQQMISLGQLIEEGNSEKLDNEIAALELIETEASNKSGSLSEARKLSIEQSAQTLSPSLPIHNGIYVGTADKAIRIPIISWVQAGDWQEVIDPFQPGYAEEWISTSATNSPNAFALTVNGDSMEPEFVEGDVIVINPERSPESGDYVIVKNGNEATFKQLVLDGASVYLKPMNNRYPIRDITGIETRIVGVVVEKRKVY